MGGGRERKEDRGRPAEKGSDGARQQITHPAEAPRGSAALELGEPFGREGAAEENGEQEKHYAADLAAEC